MDILIPSRLENHLRRDDKWSTCVTAAKIKIQTLISGTPAFFPDYTGHGIGHINEMLTAAEKLIPEHSLTVGEKDESSGILSPSDVGCLICAILIHDLGMFLKEDGVRKLITGSCGRPIRSSGDTPWRTAWQEYIDSTNRSSREVMYRQFGKLIPASTDYITIDNMGDDEKRIIGEFLRRNHGRLAHEIALRGLPGSATIDIFEGTDLETSDRDMIGLLARSHSMAIRDTEPYLKAKFEAGPMPENIPVFYLMAVLRIADLLDAGAHRAPALLLAQQNIHVPASGDEWKWNQRIIPEKCRWNLKHKNRSIYADPESSIEYVLLDKWLRWVQSELDLCWSVLSEYYPEGYRLSIHRVTSRIYQPEVQDTMRESFLPREVSVSTNPEVTQLLIAPLYGEDPSFGVRELLQNAVDACEERKYREKDHEYKGLVTVRVDPWIDPETGENLGVFTIEDNGIGMNEHVLLNYYLAAGASYRSSDEWKKEYTQGSRSQVARTGQFGVGFLAAFLLGDTVTVLTQHAGEELGYAFSYTNEARPLNISREERAEGPGTTITIRLKASVWEKLKDQLQTNNWNNKAFPWYNWYAFDEPAVQYFWDGKPMSRKGLTLFRDPRRNPDWLPLETTNFASYLWKQNFDGSSFSKRNICLCNGIRICDPGNSDTLSVYGLGVLYPHVSLIDTEKRLDVDLSRAKVQTFPEKRLLAEQVLRYHIARLLIADRNPKAEGHDSVARGFMLNHLTKIPFLLTSDSFQLNNGAVLSILQSEQYLLLCCENLDFDFASAAARKFIPKEFPCILCTDQSFDDFVRDVFDPNYLNLLDYSDGYDAEFYCVNIWVRKDAHSYIEQCDDVWKSDRKAPLDSLIQYQYAMNEPTQSPIQWNHFDPNIFPCAIQILNPNRGGDTLFARVLREVLEPAPGYDRNDIWIPFDLEERRKKFPKAFRELKPYLDYIEKYGIE